jgi:methylenetetrahydrofolate--tRNA-(uracil-5-)-methyltransferase
MGMKSAPSSKTAIGALLQHITCGHEGINFQPMNVNFGLFTPLEEKMKKQNRKEFLSQRAMKELDLWIKHF